MQDKVFIFFGCSWTYGKFINLQPGQDPSSINSSEESSLAEEYGYRGLLSKTFNAEQINFSQGGSSNARQFRLASQYFLGPKRQQVSKARIMAHLYRKVRSEHYPTVEEFVSKGQLPEFVLDEIYNINQLVDFEIFREDQRPKYVFWFITSTARIEYYNSVTQQFDNEFLNYPQSQLSKLILANYYNHDHELEKLAQQMTLWNSYFAQNNIKNVWIDTFNHHAYPMYVKNRLDFQTNYSDLMSNICLSQGFNQFKDTDFHVSNFETDDARSAYLKDQEFLNPHTLHPTLGGHKLISDILIPKVIDHFDFVNYNQGSK